MVLDIVVVMDPIGSITIAKDSTFAMLLEARRRGHRLHYVVPGGLGVRIDSAVYQGYTIPPYYDSLVGKLIVHGKTRQECLMRLKRALDEVVVDGIETTLPLFRALVREKDIIDGNYHIHWLEQFLARGGMEE